MRVKKLELDNWKRYLGHHELELRPGVYAVTASHAADKERSNWLGKSSLLGVVRFALYGEHDAPSEDKWITNGQKFGMVRVELTGGTVVERSRKLGKSTQLHVIDAGRDLSGDEAQRRIIELVGLNDDDFVATCFFRQKQMAKLITAKPAERMEIVVGWLGLEPVQRCEDNARRRLGELLEQDDDLARRQTTLQESGAALQAKFVRPDGEEEADPTLAVAALEQAAEAQRAEAQNAQDVLTSRGQWAVRAANAARYAELCAQGKIARARVDAGSRADLEAERDELRATIERAATNMSKAVSDRLQLKELVAGKFDGQCPVTKSECPAAKAVRSKLKGDTDALECAKTAEAAAGNELASLRQQQVAVETELRAELAADARLEQLRAEAKRLKPDADAIAEAGQPPDDTELRRSVEVAWGKSNAAEMRFREAYRVLNELQAVEVNLGRIGGQRAKLAKDIAIHREALIIFGRNGAQRRIAEGALAEIEADANALLVESGIDLQLEVRWSREAETKGARATQCEQCGQPYPSGRAAKQCARCGAARGPKTVDKLHVDLSNRSGAAEDLAGIAFQLAAATWLRAERGTDWSVAFVDEPFGALDGANRRALATKLATMLRGRYGFEQAFVVAHDMGITDALPDRIDITANAQGSSFR